MDNIEKFEELMFTFTNMNCKDGTIITIYPNRRTFTTEEYYSPVSKFNNCMCIDISKVNEKSYYISYWKGYIKDEHYSFLVLNLKKNYNLLKKLIDTLEKELLK